MHRLLILLLSATAWAVQQNIPAALSKSLDEWKSSVAAGDITSIYQLYSSQSYGPTPFVISADGKEKLPITAEGDFWGKNRASGMQDIQVTLRGTQEQQGAEIINLLVSYRTATQRGLRTRYVIEQQAWVPQQNSWRIAASTHSDVMKIRPPEKLNPHLYPEPSAASNELQNAIRKANTSGQRILVVFGGNWCYDCHVLDGAMHEPDLLPLVDNFIVVHVNIGDDGKQNAALVAKYQIPIEKGVPAIAVLARDGKLLYSDKHGEFEKARTMDPDVIAAFLNKWKSGSTSGSRPR